MKKILLFAVLLMSCSAAFSQKADDIFNEVKKNKGVDYSELTKEMLSIFASQAPGESSKLFDGVENMKIMSIKDEDVIGEMRVMLPKIEKGGYEIMMQESEDDANVTVYTLSKGKTITEMLIIVQDGNNCELMLFKGKIDPNKLEEMMSLMDDDDD